MNPWHEERNVSGSKNFQIETIEIKRMNVYNWILSLLYIWFVFTLELGENLIINSRFDLPDFTSTTDEI